MGAGQVIGTVAGSIIGSVIQGAGTAIGAAAGGAIGSGIDAGIANKKAKNSLPSQDSPELNSHLEYIRSKLRSMEVGSSAQNAMNDIKSSSAAIVNAVGYQGGGSNSAGNLQIALRNQGQAFNTVLAGLDERAFNYNSIVGNLIERIQQRKDELGLVSYSQAQAEKMQALSDLSKNVTGMIAYKTGDQQKAFNERRVDFNDIISRVLSRNDRAVGGGSNSIDMIDNPSGY